MAPCIQAGAKLVELQTAASAVCAPTWHHPALQMPLVVVVGGREKEAAASAASLAAAQQQPHHQQHTQHEATPLGKARNHVHMPLANCCAAPHAPFPQRLLALGMAH